MIAIICPYCQHENRFESEGEFIVRALVACDLDSGGCDRIFVLKAVRRYDVKTLKVEGEKA